MTRAHLDLDAKVQAAIRKGDVKACIALLAGRSEAERTPLSGSVFKTFDLAHSLVYSRDPAKASKKLGVETTSGAERQAILEAARIALLRTFASAESLGAVAKFVWRSVPADDDEVVKALSDRPRDLVTAWVAQLCEHTAWRWWLARRLVKEGLSDRPNNDGYVLGMVHEGHARQSPRAKEKTPLFEQDPELLEDDIWRIFEVEGNRDVSLTGAERFWQTTLLDLAASGRLDRARMLDATLSALARDFAQHKAGFYSRLHDALKPTPEERAARVGVYLELLASRIPPTVTLASRAIESLPENVELDVPSFATAAVAAARSARGKSTALVLLRLLGRHRDDADALDAVVAFLEHGSVEVIDAAMDILEATEPRRELRDRIAALVPSVAASRRARVSKLVGGGGGGKSAKSDKPAAKSKTPASASTGKLEPSDATRAGVVALEKAPAEGPWPRVTLDDRTNPAPRLDPSRVVVPIVDFAELLAVAARVLEEPKDIVACERVFDGISRLGRPPSGESKSLLKRATKVRGRTSSSIATLLCCWIEGETSAPHPSAAKYVNTQDFLERRLHNLALRVAKGVTQPLLAMPSTESFFIDPRALARRVERLGATKDIDTADAVTALLRLAPEHRGAALTMLGKVAGPLAVATRHALGGEGEKRDRTRDALWLAAECARNGDPAKSGFRWKKRVSSTSADSSWGGLETTFPEAPAKASELDADAYPALLALAGHAGNGAQFGVEETVRAMASIYPSDRRTFLAHGVDRLQRNVSWSGAEWENHVFIEQLLDPDLPLDDVSLPLLAIALNTKEARENALATDALVAAISDGRVVGPELGRAMAYFWDPIHDQVRWSQRATSARWAKTLATVAETSALHAEIVRRTIEALFASPIGALSPDAHALLQLWLDLAVEAGVGVPDAKVLLPYTGKAKKIAAQLTALEGKAKSAHADQAHALALEGRRARAQRYMSWRKGWSASSG